MAKPAGLPVHGGAGQTGRTLLDVLTAAYSAPIDLHPVHRLDRGTSGALVVAKSKDVARALGEEWPRVDKTYLAVICGAWTRDEVIDRELDGRPARTRIRPLTALAALEPLSTLVEAQLETGRTHQIRRHLSEVGHPVMLDDQYGDFARNRAFKKAVQAAGGRVPRDGLLLHALRLTLGDRKLSIVAPVPERFLSALDVAGGRSVRSWEPERS